MNGIDQILHESSSNLLQPDETQEYSQESKEELIEVIKNLQENFQKERQRYNDIIEKTNNSLLVLKVKFFFFLFFDDNLKVEIITLWKQENIDTALSRNSQKTIEYKQKIISLQNNLAMEEEKRFNISLSFFPRKKKKNSIPILFFIIFLHF